MRLFRPFRVPVGTRDWRFGSRDSTYPGINIPNCVSLFNTMILFSVCLLWCEDSLIRDLKKLCDICKGQTVSTKDDIRSYVLKLGNARLIFHELLILLTLYYTLPGSSASAERSFCEGWRCTYKVEWLLHARLNASAVGHIRRDINASLSPLDILREFSSHNQSRTEHFGKV